MSLAAAVALLDLDTARMPPAAPMPAVIREMGQGSRNKPVVR